MVGYYKAYKGSTQTPLIYANSRIVKKVYKGSNLVYQIGFSPFSIGAGTSLYGWTVPPGVSKIHVDCVASKGADGSGASGGFGGRVQCDVNVTGGQILYITVGTIPANGATQAYNAADIRTNNSGVTNSVSLSSRIVVAGGGGCAPLSYGHSGTTGGAGGGVNGGKAPDWTSGGGYGGTQYGGGAHGVQVGGELRGGGPGSDGYFGLGGTSTGSMGCGGAGWYGGGAGFTGDYRSVGVRSSGGGGGSSYTNANCSNVVHTQGYQNGNGYITISFVE